MCVSHSNVNNMASSHAIEGFDLQEEAKRDDANPAPRVNVMHGRIEVMKDEIQQRESAYRQRRSILERGVRDYDLQYQAETEAFHSKFAAMMEESTASDDRLLSELATVKETWLSKFEHLQVFAEDSLEQEREERAAAFQEMEEQLVVRDNEVEGLLDLISKQGQEIDLAKQERVELNREMKNVLVTLHIQFERLMGQAANQTDALAVVREEHKYSCEKLDRRLSELVTYVDSIQRDVSQVEKETKDSLRTTTDKLAIVREEIGDKVQALWNIQQCELVDQIQRQSRELTSVVAEVKTVLQEQDQSRELHDKLDCRLVEAEDKANVVQEVLADSGRTVEELKSFVNKNAAENMQVWLSEKIEIVNQLQWQSELIKKSTKELNDVNTKCDAMKIDAEVVGATWSTSFEELNNQVKEHGANIATTVNDLAGTKHGLLILDGEMKTKLGDLMVQVQENEDSQDMANAELMEKHNNLDENLKALDSGVVTITDQLTDVIRKVQLQEDDHKNIKLHIKKTQVKSEFGFNGFQSNLDDCSLKIEGITILLQQRSEAQSLASKDFREKQDVLEQKLKSCGRQYEVLERRVSEAEGILSAGTPELVEMMIQPWMKKQDILRDNLRKQSDDVKVLRDDMKLTQKARDAVTQRVDTMNKTWESLFQHLVCQVKKDTADMISTKSESEIVLKDMKNLLSTWESHLGQLSRTQTSCTSEFMAEIQSHKQGMEALQRTMDSHSSRLATVTEQLAEQRDLQSSHLQQQSQLEERLVIWKVELDAKVVGQCEAPRKVTKNQAVKVAVCTDSRIDEWNSAAKQFAQAQQEAAELRQAIITVSEKTSSREKATAIEKSEAQRNAQFDRIAQQVERQSIEIQTCAGKKSSLQPRRVSNGKVEGAVELLESQQQEESRIVDDNNEYNCHEERRE